MPEAEASLDERPSAGGVPGTKDVAREAPAIYRKGDSVAQALANGDISRRTYDVLVAHGLRTLHEVLQEKDSAWRKRLGRTAAGQLDVLRRLAETTIKGRRGTSAAESPEAPLYRLYRLALVVLSEEQWSVLASRQRDDTLQKIADRLHLSRERIRQLEAKAERQLHVLLAAEPELVRNWRAHLESPAVSEKDILGPFLDRARAMERQREIARFCLRMIGAEHPLSFSGRRLTDFWTLNRDSLTEVLRKLTAQVPSEDEGLKVAVRQLGFDTGVPIDEILREHGSPITFHPTVAAWVRSVGRDRDAAWLVLQRVGMPMTAADLARAVGLPEHNLDEAMRRDQRFIQLSPSGRWTIEDWNVRESQYKTTLEAAIAVLTELGPQRLAQLTRNVIARYSVSPAAVAQCINHEDIGRWPDGRLDLALRGAPVVRDSAPTLPYGVFPENAGRVLAILEPVTRDVLRGSGISVPRYVSWALGMSSAPQQRSFHTANGDTIIVRRRIQGTSLSTLRRLAEKLGAREGCAMIIRLNIMDGSAEATLGCNDECTHRQSLTKTRSASAATGS